MGSIKRAERRREIKAIGKELEYIRKHTEFNKLMQSDSLANLPKEEIEQLKKKEHPNAILQERYNTGMLLLKRVLTLESRLIALRNPVEDFTNVNQE